MQRNLARAAAPFVPLLGWVLFACSGDASADSTTTRAAAAATTSTATARGAHPAWTPPAEAVAACASLAEGAVCTIDRAGTCKAVGAAVACEPAPPAPPAEAVAACASSSAGDACTVTLGDHQLTGTCTSRDAGPLACAPGHHGRRPPPEAAAACASLTSGAACSMTVRDGKVLSGTCVADNAGTLGCRPERAAPVEAITACGGLAAGAACTLSLSSTCRAMIDGTLACLPAHRMHGHGGPGGPGAGAPPFGGPGGFGG